MSGVIGNIGGVSCLLTGRKMFPLWPPSYVYRRFCKGTRWFSLVTRFVYISCFYRQTCWMHLQSQCYWMFTLMLDQSIVSCILFLHVAVFLATLSPQTLKNKGTLLEHRPSQRPDSCSEVFNISAPKTQWLLPWTICHPSTNINDNDHKSRWQMGTHQLQTFPNTNVRQ